MLVRAPRRAGMPVAATATTAAKRGGQPDRGGVQRGAAGAAEQAGAGVGQRGRDQPPGRQPGDRARCGEQQVLCHQHERDEPGVAPTALSSPTRRVCSAIRPPTMTAIPAMAMIANRTLPITSSWRSLAMAVLSSARIPCQLSKNQAAFGVLWAAANARRGRGIGELEVERVPQRFAAVGPT